MTQNSTAKPTQQQNFATNSDPAKGISLCIPRVFNNIGWKRIKRHMIEANLGYVERVDVIPLGAHKRAFVHFRAGGWNMRDETARAALKALQEGKKIKLEYEAPWYWLVSISGAQRPAEAPKPRERKTTIDLNPSLPVKKSTPKVEKSEPTTHNPKNDPIVARATQGVEHITLEVSED